MSVGHPQKNFKKPVALNVLQTNFRIVIYWLHLRKRWPFVIVGVVAFAAADLVADLAVDLVVDLVDVDLVVGFDVDPAADLAVAPVGVVVAN